MSVVEPWTVAARRTVYDGAPWLRLDVEEVVLPDGRHVVDYHQLVMPETVVAIVVGADARILLLRQYKHGARSICLALPGGALSGGELPAELREETGYEARGGIPRCRSWASHLAVGIFLDRLRTAAWREEA